MIRVEALSGSEYLTSLAEQHGWGVRNFFERLITLIEQKDVVYGAISICVKTEEGIFIFPNNAEEGKPVLRVENLTDFLDILREFKLLIQDHNLMRKTRWVADQNDLLRVWTSATTEDLQNPVGYLSGVVFSLKNTVFDKEIQTDQTEILKSVGKLRSVDEWFHAGLVGSEDGMESPYEFKFASAFTMGPHVAYEDYLPSVRFGIVDRDTVRIYAVQMPDDGGSAGLSRSNRLKRFHTPSTNGRGRLPIGLTSLAAALSIFGQKGLTKVEIPLICPLQKHLYPVRQKDGKSVPPETIDSRIHNQKIQLIKALEHTVVGIRLENSDNLVFLEMFEPISSKIEILQEIITVARNFDSGPSSPPC